MVKLFFAGIAVIALVVLGTATTFFSPLLIGIDRNLGGSPTMPFHSPIPQPVADSVHGVISGITPGMWLTVVLGFIALLCVYTIGSLLGQMLRRNRDRRERWALLRFRARVIAARANQDKAAAPKISTASRAEYESMWE